MSMLSRSLVKHLCGRGGMAARPRCLWKKPVHHNRSWLHMKSWTEQELVANSRWCRYCVSYHRRWKNTKLHTEDRVLSLRPNTTPKELATATGVKINEVLEVLSLLMENQTPEPNSPIRDRKVLEELARDLGFELNISDTETDGRDPTEDLLQHPPPDPSALVRRPPVVTIMGHVDHGKTTLLDSLRNSNIIAQEFGGITQHTGAFSVQLKSGEQMTFLDTPGHAAFSAMRARGAQLTDIIVLVVAAEDGVKQQTAESIQHAKTAGVPLIVAINKVDKPEADIENTQTMLMQHDVIVEELGGDVQAVPISALKGTNLTELQEAIVTQAEVMDLKGDPVGLVEGQVVEAKTVPGRGHLVTAVIQRGTLKKQDILVCGTAWTKVRGMFSDKGKPLQKAGLSAPVEIIGWKSLPSAGDEIFQVKTEKEAKAIVEKREAQEREDKLVKDFEAIQGQREEHSKMITQRRVDYKAAGRKTPWKQQKTKEALVLREGLSYGIVLKGDVDGTVEAILDVLDSFQSKKIHLDILHYGVGNITEKDVQLAQTFDGEVYGFNVKTDTNVAKSNKDIIKIHKVIYKLFDDLKASIESRLPSTHDEVIVGEAMVLQMFSVTEGKKKVLVAGCRCTKGTLNKKMMFRVERDGEEIFLGTLSSMKHHKHEVETIKVDVECGLAMNDLDVQLETGDRVICFNKQQIPEKLDWDPGF